VANPTKENCTALIAFAWLLGIQRCAGALYSKNEPLAPDPDSSISSIIEFLMPMRGGCEMVLKFQHLLPVGSDFLLLRKELEGLLGPRDGPHCHRWTRLNCRNTLRCHSLCTTSYKIFQIYSRTAFQLQILGIICQYNSYHLLSAIALLKDLYFGRRTRLLERHRGMGFTNLGRVLEPT
jgi:hypothetical protein